MRPTSIIAYAILKAIGHADVWLFHIRVGQNFDSNLLEEAESEKDDETK